MVTETVRLFTIAADKIEKQINLLSMSVVSQYLYEQQALFI